MPATTPQGTPRARAPGPGPHSPEAAWTPRWIAWESTRRCNLTCVHCRCSADLKQPRELMDTRAACAMLDDIAAVSAPVFVLSGGEPLLRPDLYDIASHANGKGMRVCIATNGALLDDAHCRAMQRANIRMVSLSLDGPNAAVHDDFRQAPGAFDAVLRATQLLRRHGLPFIVNSSFTRRNQAHIAATFELARSLGATAWYLFMIVPTGRGETLMTELIPASDYDDILAWHYEQEKQTDDILMRPTCAPHYYRVVPQMNKGRDGNDRLKRRSLTLSTGSGKGCIAGQNIAFIDAAGEVKPCSYLPLSAGNLTRHAFADIWQNAPLLRNLRDFSTYQGRCGRCEYLNVCGGCRARAYTVTGDYLAEEPYCSHQPARSGTRPVATRAARPPGARAAVRQARTAAAPSRRSSSLRGD